MIAIHAKDETLEEEKSEDILFKARLSIAWFLNYQYTLEAFNHSLDKRTDLIKSKCLFQKLEENQDETNEDPSWADTKMLKRQFQGLKDIQFHPGKKF